MLYSIDCYDLSDQAKSFVALLGNLLKIPSPGGREWQMAETIFSSVAEMGYTAETDPAGNVLVRIEGSDGGAQPCIFAAHMDEIGLVVREVREDGSLVVDKSGGLIPYKLGERPLQFLGDNETIVALPNLGHGHGGGQFASGITWDDVSITTGLSRAQLKQAGIRPGTTGVPVAEGRGPIVFGDKADPMLAAWLFDNRAGVAIQLEVLRLIKAEDIKPRRPIIFAFTVHEEGGCHGSKILARCEQPEILIAVDGCPITPHCGAVLSEHPVIWSKDRYAHYDQRMVMTLIDAVKKAGLDRQTAVQATAATDASAAYNAGHVPRAAVISYPKNCSHGYELAKLAVFPNLVRTILTLLTLDNW